MLLKEDPFAIGPSRHIPAEKGHAFRPIFVLCAPRTGSTLLRYVLDNHPSVACPPETNLAGFFARLTDAVTKLEQPLRLAGTFNRETEELCRYFADRINGVYARNNGASRWADKSLTSAFHAPLLKRLYPEAQFICLYRDARDTMASLLEASPFGFGHFGLEPYARNNVTNLLEACGQLWCDVVSLMIDFERHNRQVAIRVRYEDLVRRPKVTTRRIFRFLELPYSDDILDPKALFARRNRSGCGDFKIHYSTTFDAQSIGRGTTLPVEVIDERVRERINALQHTLRYSSLEDAGLNKSPGRSHDAPKAAPREATRRKPRGAARVHGQHAV
jgi:protein-tyrosine sulfotransferase